MAGLALYEWDSLELVRRIEIQPKNVYWSESGELICIATEESFYILKYYPDNVQEAKENRAEKFTEDGVEDAFDVVSEVQESVKTGLWVGDCFIYTNGVNRLNYYVGGEIVTIAHLDKVTYLLGYIPKDNRLYLGDKELNIISYSLLLPVLEYQTAVMRGDFEAADKILPSIPNEQKTRVAHFLEKQGFKIQALTVSKDQEHRFDLALQLKETKIAYQLATEAQSEQKWRQLAELAMTLSQFNLAQECLQKANDYPGLLLLATSNGDAGMVKKLGESASSKGMNNVAFLANFITGDKKEALETLIRTNRLPEAAFFARTYLPSQVSRIIQLWKESVAQNPKGQKSAQALADPQEYENLFPGFSEALKEEEKDNAIKKQRPARLYGAERPAGDRRDDNVSEKMSPESPPDNFEEAPSEFSENEDLNEDVNNLNIDDDVSGLLNTSI